MLTSNPLASLNGPGGTSRSVCVGTVSAEASSSVTVLQVLPTGELASSKSHPTETGVLAQVPRLWRAQRAAPRGDLALLVMGS